MAWPTNRNRTRPGDSPPAHPGMGGNNPIFNRMWPADARSTVSSIFLWKVRPSRTSSAFNLLIRLEKFTGCHFSILTTGQNGRSPDGLTDRNHFVGSRRFRPAQREKKSRGGWGSGRVACKKN